MEPSVFLMLGSNLSDPPSRLAEACRNIEMLAGKIVAASSMYRSAAWGLKDQPDFYNQALKITTSFAPDALLKVLLDIEQQMGRERRLKWGPRLIDIDLLFYGDSVIDTAFLKLPHPGIPARRFVLEPLSEIGGDFTHPILNKTIRSLLHETAGTLPVERVGPSRL